MIPTRTNLARCLVLSIEGRILWFVEKMIVVNRESYFCATLSNDPTITITKQCGATKNFLLSIKQLIQKLNLSSLESYRILFSITWLFIAARRYQALHLLLGTTRWFRLDFFSTLDFSWSINWKLELNSLEIKFQCTLQYYYYVPVNRIA